jgi:mono/diheme cytochrome c family protein
MRLGSFALAAMLALAGCARKPLPETGTAGEQLYAQRCGTCHRAYQPSTLTPAMWQIQVEAMQLKMQNAGIAPLTGDEQAAILNYLQRNASQSQ